MPTTNTAKGTIHVATQAGSAIPKAGSNSNIPIKVTSHAVNFAISSFQPPFFTYL